METVWTGILAAVSGIIGGGGLVALYNAYKKAGRDDQEFTRKEYQTLILEMRARNEAVERAADELKGKYATAVGDNITLRARLSAYEERWGATPVPPTKGTAS